MDGAKFENEPTYKGRKVVVWVIAIFFAMSIVCSVGTYLFGENLTPYLLKKNEEAKARQNEGQEAPTDVR